jgi:peptide/nickel transport system substrate-binding protein
MSVLKKAITTAQAGIIIVVIVVAAVVIAYTQMAPQSSQPTQSSAASTAVAGSKTVDTLSIDDWLWPIDDLNALYSSWGEVPWPNPMWFAVYQPLVQTNLTAEYKQGVIQFLPGLATSWTPSADGKMYTVSLRQNVTFSNGDPFNAYQVWALMYGSYYLSGNSTGWFCSYPIFDMSTSNFGPATIALMTKSGLINPSQDLLNIMMNKSWPIYVTDQYTIVFQLVAPFQWFPGTLVGYGGVIYDIQYVLNNGGFGAPPTPNTYFNQHPIPGTGPYMFVALSENAWMKFTQNPNYWGLSLTADEVRANPMLDPGHAKNVIVYIKSDDVARYTDLANGVVQLAAIQQPNWNLVTSNPQTYSYLKLPPWNGEVSLLGLNTHMFPTDIREFRQAIVHDINYTDLYAKAFLGQMNPYVGPEYPAWKDYYNLGNTPSYDYNVTLAQEYLAKAEAEYPNLTTSMPTLTFRVVAGCPLCTNAAQAVQADLANLGISVNVVVQTNGPFYSVLGSYASELANPQPLGQLAFVNSGFGWGPATLTPADYWVSFVSNQSTWGNYAIYYDPVVQKCVNSFTNGSDQATIQSACMAAQAKLYDDAPYAWIGTFGLWEPSGGSIVWKNGVITGFYTDPVWTGMCTAPLLNTVTFGPNA